jgi:hypothetical protein
MKRVIVILLVLSVFVGLAGCGGAAETSTYNGPCPLVITRAKYHYLEGYSAGDAGWNQLVLDAENVGSQTITGFTLGVQAYTLEVT